MNKEQFMSVLEQAIERQHARNLLILEEVRKIMDPSVLEQVRKCLDETPLHVDLSGLVAGKE